MKKKLLRRWIPSVVLPGVLAIACLGGGLIPGTPDTPAQIDLTTEPGDDTSPAVVPATPPPGEDAAFTATSPPDPTTTSTPAVSAQQICESLPVDAVSTFLYGLSIGTIVGEQQLDGVYCRFETVDVSGTAGDLGRSRAVATVKLWDGFDDCLAARSELAAEVDEPPAPWSYLRLVPIPNDPNRILSLTGFDGQSCQTVAAADVSSQPLDVWLALLGALAAAR